jgi:hypothetical protein
MSLFYCPCNSDSEELEEDYKLERRADTIIDVCPLVYFLESMFGAFGSQYSF